MTTTHIRNIKTGKCREVVDPPGGIVQLEENEVIDGVQYHAWMYAPASEADEIADHSEPPTPGWQTKDSGAREVMETGSQRDTREGKGRFELISPFALMRLAGVYERGAKKYDARNWEKGQPFSRFLDSALRHLNRFAMGWTDEDHLSQALWNVAAIIHFQELGRTDLDDMPHYQEGPKA